MTTIQEIWKLVYRVDELLLKPRSPSRDEELYKIRDRLKVLENRAKSFIVGVVS